MIIIANIIGEEEDDTWEIRDGCPEQSRIFINTFFLLIKIKKIRCK
jgi:hypothetical protein